MSFGDFDKMLANGDASMKAATDDERKTLQTFMAEGVISTETFRFRLDPAMSYVPKEVRASRLLGAEEAHGDAGPETHDESVVRSVAPGRHAPAPALTFAAP